MSAVVLQVTPLAVDRDTAAAMCNLGRTAFSAAVARGLLPKPKQINGAARWSVRALAAAIDKLPDSQLLPPPSAGDRADA